MDGTTTAISLEMHLAGDCLTGTATSSTGVERPFCGWLGLIAAIDELLGTSITTSSHVTPTHSEEAE
jgi:hypothetical protein